MKINIKSTNIELTESLKEWTNKKLGEIDLFLGDFAPESIEVGQREKAEIWVEIGKITRHHRKGEVFRAEAQLYLPKKKIKVEATSQDLRTAINAVKDELQRSIRKYKGKRIDRARKWARRFKETMRVDQWLIKPGLQKIFKKKGKK